MYPALLIAVLMPVCSTDGFLELFRNWPVTTAKRLSLTYGKPEVSCNSLVDMFLGKRGASQMKESCNFCILVMTVSETVIVEITPNSNIGLAHCLKDLQNCLWASSLLLIEQHSYVMIFLLAAF